ncbi:alanine racemase [Paenibacillus sp. 1P07SE]|uniref:alanine racemase n=1 Tax=Paenibacillus sp. 1P07SE TaxID=3132209 RepID=UPI0039A51A8F
MMEQQVPGAGERPPFRERAVSYRPTRAEISETAIRGNVRRFVRSLANGCHLMAVVKADGYGHGMAEVAALALEEGAERIGVAIPEEAFALRYAGVTAPILILGYTPPSAVETAVRFDVAMTVYTDEVIREIAVVCERVQQAAAIHLKLDTGMSRLGVATEEEANRLAALASRSQWITLEGVYTHFACASEEDPAMTERQFQRYRAIVAGVERRHGVIPIKHCCNTAATMKFPHMHLDMARVGIGLYGLSPLAHPEPARGLPPLLPALALKTAVANIVSLPAGGAVSYGGTHRAPHDSRIAVLPIGYADGLPRSLSNKGYVLVLGQRVPIVGNICMDQTMVDVSEVPGAIIGTEVILIGASEQGAVITADELAHAAGTIHYEIVTRIGARVPRTIVQAPGRGACTQE